MRIAEIKRKTNETDIELKLALDGRGTSSISSGSAFLDHMLTLFAKHGKFDLTVSCSVILRLTFITLPRISESASVKHSAMLSVTRRE